MRKSARFAPGVSKSGISPTRTAIRMYTPIAAYSIFRAPYCFASAPYRIVNGKARNCKARIVSSSHPCGMPISTLIGAAIMRIVPTPSM